MGRGRRVHPHRKRRRSRRKMKSETCAEPLGLSRGDGQGAGRICHQGPWAPAVPTEVRGGFQCTGVRPCTRTHAPPLPSWPPRGPPPLQHPQWREEVAGLMTPQPTLPSHSPGGTRRLVAMAGGRFLEDTGRGQAHTGSELGCRQTACADRPHGAQLGGHHCPGRATWRTGEGCQHGAGAQGGTTLHLRATDGDARASSCRRQVLDAPELGRAGR